MRTLLLSLLICISCSSFSQSFKYRSYKYSWSPRRPEAIPVVEQFKNEDAVILDEHCIYNASGNKVPLFYYFNKVANYYYFEESTQGSNPVVQKHLRIKFLSKNGIKKYSKIVLPESFDPEGDQNSVKLEYRDSIYRPKGEFECIRYFAARIIKADGRIENAVVDESIQTDVQRINKIENKFYSWIFRIINLEEGDELELDYSYEGAWNLHPSQRIFFNGELPKQNFDLTFRCFAKSSFFFSYYNEAEPSGSTMETLNAPHYTEYYFSKKNLTGGICEAGARPQLQLPYFTYYKHLLDYGLDNPKASGSLMPQAYPWSYTLIPFVGYQYDDLKLRLEKRDQTTVSLNQFLETEKQKVHDTSYAGISSSIQHTLAEEFGFKKDAASELAGDAELEHLGKYVSDKILRETSRLRIYKEILSRFDREYYLVALTDKRISEINIKQYEPLPAMDSAFAIPTQHNFLFLYPKAYRFGYEANELPFYYEDVNTILIPQHEPSFKRREYIPQVDYIFLKTPFSSVKENVRTTNAMLNVSLDSLKMSYSGKIKLAGQFSTLIRGYYIYGDRDTTVNPNYYHSITALADGKADLKVVNVNRQFPFDASFNTSFTNHRNINKERDGIYSVELIDFFNEVVDDKFTSDHRHLDYYPDFQFQDSYKYMMKFDRKIKLENVDSLQKNIHNSFADYILKTTQVDDQSVLIEISYVVKPEFVLASLARDVSDVFDEIKKVNNASLILKIQ